MTEGLTSETTERIEEVRSLIGELRTKASDRGRAQDKALRGLEDRCDKVDREMLEAGAVNDTTARAANRRLDELEKLGPQQKNIEHKLGLALERQ